MVNECQKREGKCAARERERKIRHSENNERGEVRTGPKPEKENDKRLQKKR